MNNIWQPVDNLIDFNVWLFLQWYYMPAYLMGKGSDMDQWISSFSTNGIKSFVLGSNLCQPKFG